MNGSVADGSTGCEGSSADAPELRIGDRVVSVDRPAYLIAELGSNHDCRLERAFELIRAAADAGADAVKFQSFCAGGLARRGDAAFPILDRLTLPASWHAQLRDVAAEQGVDFLSTPFDEQRALLLAGLGVPAFKIASGDLTHVPLLESVAGYGRPLLVSTGLADLAEVGVAVETIRAAGAPVALLHCCAAYPADARELNLRAIQTLAREFDTVVGLSDHSPGHAAALAAIALGARIIEKHLTFDRSLEGPDHSYALQVEEFASMVEDIRCVEFALGDGRKEPARSETAGRVAGRRSLHAALEIPAGARIDPEMIKIVRPAEGIAPAHASEIRGRRALRTLAPDEPIRWEDLQ